jgi:hypothetical protein
MAIECNPRNKTLETSSFVLVLHVKQPTAIYLQNYPPNSTLRGHGDMQKAGYNDCKRTTDEQTSHTPSTSLGNSLPDVLPPVLNAEEEKWRGIERC